MGKKAIQTKNAPAAVGPYSQAVQVGDFLYVSGQIPLDPQTGMIVSGGIEAQTHQVFRNLAAILDDAGLTFDAVVKTTVLLNSMNDFGIVNSIYSQHIRSEVLPARAAFAVEKLPKDALIEIELVAWCCHE